MAGRYDETRNLFSLLVGFDFALVPINAVRVHSAKRLACDLAVGQNATYAPLTSIPESFAQAFG